MSNDPRARAARLLAGSRYAMPIQEAFAHVQARRAELLVGASEAPDPDFTAPEPLPLADPVHDAPGFARAFWARKKNQPNKPPGRRPKGELTPEHDRFRVVDGDRDDGDNER